MIESLVKFSTNEQWRGKPLKVEEEVDGKVEKYYTYLGKRVNQGWGWGNQSTTFRQWFEWATIDGYPTGPCLTADGNKCAATFKSHDMLLIDIDENMTIEELKKDYTYRTYGSGFYTSPSHTDHHHKFRIIFLLETRIVRQKEMKALYKAMIHHFGKVADSKCTDPGRYFNGTVMAERRCIRDRYLPANICRNFIRNQIADDEQRELENLEKASRYNNDDISKEDRSIIIDLCCGLGYGHAGGYGDWRNLGWGLKHGGFEVHDYIHITNCIMRQKSAEDCLHVWNASGSGVTVATVINAVGGWPVIRSFRRANNNPLIPLKGGLRALHSLKGE